MFRTTAKVIILGVAGGAATTFLWFLLAVILWFPYGRELRATGWMYFHDIDYTILLAFIGPMMGLVFAVLFFITSSLKLPLPAQLLITASVPFLIVLYLNLRLDPLRWSFPGAEIAVALTGLLLVALGRSMDAARQRYSPGAS